MKRMFLLLFGLLLLSFVVLADSAKPDLSSEVKKISHHEVYKNFFALPDDELEKHFSVTFLNQVNIDKILEIRKLYIDTLGEFIEAVNTETGFKLVFSEGEALSNISTDQENKIASMWFGIPKLTTDSLDEICKDYKNLPFKVSVCLLQHNANGEDEKEILVINHKEPLGCGSAFKLYLLKALDEAVTKGELKMSDTISLNEDSISFPSGLLQEWPLGSCHTLETLAGLMISVSDNTATDHIIKHLGFENLRSYFPESCTELLTTAQFIKLKFFYKQLAEEYVKADKNRKSEILKEIDAQKAAELDLSFITKQSQKPFLVNELEWHISTQQLCRIIYSLRDNKLLRINPAHGIAQKSDWNIIGYKGGSEPGVLNFTWVMQKTPDSLFYTLSCTAINTEQDIDISEFSMLAIRLMNLIGTLN